MADPTTSNADSTTHVQKGWVALKQHVIENKIKVGLWATRVFTIFFTLGYIIPIFGNPYNAYYKAMLACAATYALRLHQRTPRVQFTREFYELLRSEDSFHYLLYTAIFCYVSPVTLILAPVFLFALLHAASYSLTLLDCLGQNSWWGARLAISLVEFQSRNILRLCALCEIIILPLTLILVFTGKAGFLTPYVYYKFLLLRLDSRRNPYTRNVFFELRGNISNLLSSPSISEVLKKVIRMFLTVTQNMVPVQPTNAQ